MSTTNLWKRLKQLLPDAPLLTGQVVAIQLYGAIVQLPDGALVSVRGEAVLNQHVFIRDGVIEGPAPEMTAVLIEI
jgi:hypothetical protein